ncbi:hypothetical protein BV20DRAFT_1038516 [Pilatotrama ljubarskyi]|nr:hypothetical protein BV20DRAFT_1038516 [Pilatotrama ljubarskyi]
MSLPSLESSSPASSQAISLASQSAALVSDVLEFSGLSTASFPISFRKFVECIRPRPQPGTFPVSCFEIYKDTSASSSVRQATMGILGHQFNVATVLLLSGRKTHIRADYWAEVPPGASSRLVLIYNDDHAALTKDAHLISREKSGPTLESLAALFDVADKRLGSKPYGVFGRNCFWMTDMLFYTMAWKYSAHWLAGALTPEAPLKRYLRGEVGALEAAIACATPSEAARWWARWSGNAVRGIQVFFTQNGPDRFMMHDDEVADWIRAWDEEVQKKSSESESKST